ncbi:MAG: leucine-rich repeat domain-containing protein [Clostridiales bacterium]|nr:leucine-rich repeat domain-containing protein [Clostridiales bacterium]
MEFLYTVKGNEVCLDKILEPESETDIPEILEGLPVTELGAYVLSGTAIEVVHIPPQVRKIGAYAFYSCAKLKKIYCYGRATDLGAGVFADDRRIAYLDLTVFAGERSCMKEMLSEIRQTLRVQIHEVNESRQPPTATTGATQTTMTGTKAKEARLIFPEYFEESVENTPARKLMVETHGCGQRYRYCFVRREFQYAGYDDLFVHAQVQESEELSAEMAIGRLRYPRELGNRSRERYETYLREHWCAAAKVAIRADHPARQSVSNVDPETLPWLIEELIKPDPEQLREITDIAQREQDTAMVSWLMDYRHRIFGKETNAANGGRRRRFVL